MTDDEREEEIPLLPEEEEEERTSAGNLMDSRTSHLDDLLADKLLHAFQMPTSERLFLEVGKIASEYHPIDLAYAVTRLPPPVRYVVYDALPDLPSKIYFIINAGNTTRGAILRQLDDQQLKMLIDLMPSDEAVDLLEDLSNRRVKRLLELLDPKKAQQVRLLFEHERHTAGRLMTNECFSFPMHALIGEVVAKIRAQPGIELTRLIFVLNDADELVGCVPDRVLLVNPHFIALKQVMHPITHYVTPDTLRDEIVDLVERYKIAALPVVDDQKRLLGVITYEDVVELLEDIADETIATIAGTVEEIGEHAPVFRRFLLRAPWLLFTLCAGMFNAHTISHFSAQAWFLFVPMFVPLITGMSGNVGVQCSTVLVRGMSTGELSVGERRSVICEELTIGLLAGSIFGLFCGGTVSLLNYFQIYDFGAAPLLIAVIVGCGVLSACLTATFLGTFSPFLFAALRIDPAIASGPIVTACNDTLSTLMFFLVAQLIAFSFNYFQ